MAKKSQQNRQKAIMKKRRKDKVRKKAQPTVALDNPRSIIRKARTFPLYDCQIGEDWQGGEGLVQIAIAREQPDGGIAFGVYLVDKFCLGLKNTFCDANFSVHEWQNVLDTLDSTTPLKTCSPDFAQQFIYQAIDYAEQFGFQPDKDFRWSKYVLDKRGDFKEGAEITFGKDGKPLFIAGPHDDAKAIVARLEQNPGPGNYDYLVPVGDPFVDDVLLGDDVEADEDNDVFIIDQTAGGDDNNLDSA